MPSLIRISYKLLKVLDCKRANFYTEMCALGQAFSPGNNNNRQIKSHIFINSISMQRNYETSYIY